MLRPDAIGFEGRGGGTTLGVEELGLDELNVSVECGCGLLELGDDARGDRSLLLDTMGLVGAVAKSMGAGDGVGDRIGSTISFSLSRV